MLVITFCEFSHYNICYRHEFIINTIVITVDSLYKKTVITKFDTSRRLKDIRLKFESEPVFREIFETILTRSFRYIQKFCNWPCFEYRETMKHKTVRLSQGLCVANKIRTKTSREKIIDST